MEWIPTLSPTSCVSRGASPEVRWSPPLFWKRHIQSLPDFPQEFCSTASSTTLLTEWIPALSPTWWNFQTTTKSFVDKRRPWQNGVPDQHVGDKLSFQVNRTLWINSIALSSSNHPSSRQNHWWIRSGFPLSPQLEETSKPQQKHWLIKQNLGRTEYLIDTWATNWVFKSIERFESTA